MFEAFQACQTSEEETASDIDAEKPEDKLIVDDIDDQEDEDKENLDSAIPNGQQSPSISQKSLKTAKERRKEFENVLSSYYKGSWYGHAASGLLYTLAMRLSRTNNDILWDCIIGLTEQYLNDKIDLERYQSLISPYNNEVSRFNATDSISSYDDSFLSSSSNDCSSFEGKIKYEEEYKFMLLRHWTLYNSMFHSSYIATKLSVWREKGKRRLETLLAKMG